jgi:hypothetical protein
MKKLMVILALALAVSISGCKSSPAAANSGTAPANIPEWVVNPPLQEDSIFGIGSAKLSSDQRGMEMAEARARQSLAFQLNTNVQAMITDYARDAGTTNNTATLELAETVGRQLTQTTLVGATPSKREKTPDGTWWVMIDYKKTDASRAVAGIIDNEAARYSEFKAMEALKLMDAQLDKINTKPEVVGE